MSPMFTDCEPVSSRKFTFSVTTKASRVATLFTMRKHYLREYRDLKGWTQDQLAEAAGYVKSTISMIENRKRNFTAESLERISAALGIDAQQMMIPPADGAWQDLGANEGIPIVGYVSAGGETYTLWDYEQSQLDRLPMMLQGAEMALPVKGESMFPRFKEGEFVVAGAVQSDIRSLVGRDVVARTEDGRIVLKQLASCPTGRWTLESVNPQYRRIEDVNLEWVRPVLSNIIWPS